MGQSRGVMGAVPIDAHGGPCYPKHHRSAGGYPPFPPQLDCGSGQEPRRRISPPRVLFVRKNGDKPED